jgi:hypothetical protein
LPMTPKDGNGSGYQEGGRHPLARVVWPTSMM